MLFSPHLGMIMVEYPAIVLALSSVQEAVHERYYPGVRNGYNLGVSCLTAGDIASPAIPPPVDPRTNALVRLSCCVFPGCPGKEPTRISHIRSRDANVMLT